MYAFKLLLIGCGGIGSWFCHFLADGIRNGVINAEVTVADGDKVEPKNLMYSNFDAMDIGDNKAKVLAKRYSFEVLPEYICNQKDLRGYNIVVVATDDGNSRKMVYESGVEWIDLRSKGRGFAVFAKGNKSTEDMLKTLELERPRESCQEDYRLAENKIDAGNLIAATIGYQFLLNYLRNEMSLKEMRGYM